MTEVVLQRTGIVAIVGELVSAGMPEHVRARSVAAWAPLRLASAQRAFSITRAWLPFVILCELVHTDILQQGGNVRPRITGQCSFHGTEAHVRRPITIVIAASGLIALMFWLGIGATGKDSVVVSAPLKPEYALTSDPYSPVRKLEPAY